MRCLIKFCLFVVCVALVAPLIAIAWLEKHVLPGEVLFTLFAQVLAVAPGLPGS